MIYAQLSVVIGTALALFPHNANASISDGFWCRPIAGQPPVANVQLLACGKEVTDPKQTTVCVQNVECAFVGKEIAASLAERQTAIEKEIREKAKVKPYEGQLNLPSDPNPRLTETLVQLSALGDDLTFLEKGVDWLKSTVTCEGKLVDDKGKNAKVECPSANDCKSTTLVRAVAAVPTVGGFTGMGTLKYNKDTGSKAAVPAK